MGVKYLLLQFLYFISLEITNTQKSEVFLLRISSQNLIVICQHPQIY